MDSSEQDQADKSSPEEFSDSSLSPDPPGSYDIFGEPLVHPHIGDEYQAEIPSILSKSELLQQMTNPANSKGIVDSSHSFLIGLPLPVMWICNQENLIKGSTESLNKPRAVCLNGLVEAGNNVGISNISSVKEELNVKVDAPDQTYSLVPGQSSAPWSDFEADCFLLALYIFGKNLVQVMKFMDSKGVGQILAFYYGHFYGSTGYRRWSECRKMRNKKCFLGHRFFTGYRQHELFVRLAPRLSEESKSKFLEVSRAFVEGRTSLEEYVSSLKVLVGIHALVEAVGIGKGKDDLTTPIDGTKNSNLFTHRPEIPSGKACSSLTCAEIVKFLTGDFRLSKARSNDLFWEAVWPRLLARGWHSEQPSGDNYAGLKNCLVFLMPGIRKFSRRKLLKGDHYFDSISDVLAKIANEPTLLELEVDETTPSSSKLENGWAVDVKSDDDLDLFDHERHCYLKPRVSSEISDLLKFTVVDTSLANEDNLSKVRVLRSLPVEVKRCSSFKRTDRLKVHADNMRYGLQSSTSLSPFGVTTADGSCKRMPGSPNLVSPEEPGDSILPEDHKLRTIKHQFSRRNKPSFTRCSSGQVTKRRRLACVEEDVTCILALPARTHKTKIKFKSKNGATSKAMTNNDVPSRVTPSDDAKVISTKSLVEGTSDEKIPRDKCLVNFAYDVSLEKDDLAKEPEVIDLNLPQAEPESNGRVKLEVEPESDGKVKLEAVAESDGKVTLEGAKKGLFQLAESKNSEQLKDKDQLVSRIPMQPTNKGGDALDQQQPRRQSTRNRPLTTKALEALEIGLLDPVRHSRKRSMSLQEQKAKRSRQPRCKNPMSHPVVDKQVKEAADENCNGKLSETLRNAISVEKATDL